MIPDAAPKPVSKLAPHQRRSSSGERLISTSVTVDPATASLSLSFSNLSDFASHGRLNSTNNDNNQENTTKNDERTLGAVDKVTDADNQDNNEQDTSGAAGEHDPTTSLLNQDKTALHYNATLASLPPPRVGTHDVDTNNRDNNSLAQSLTLSLPDLITTSEPLVVPPPPQSSHKPGRGHQGTG